MDGGGGCGTLTFAVLDDDCLSTCSPDPNILDTKLIAIGIPIDASVPRNPPSICLRVGLIISRPPVLWALLIWFICAWVNSRAKGGKNGKNFFGIVIPFPNILFIPSSPSAVAAPVANAGTAFEIPFIAYGSTLAPRDASDENKFPPWSNLSFTYFYIWSCAICQWFFYFRNLSFC